MSMYEVQIYAPEGDRVEVLLIEEDKIWHNASQSEVIPFHGHGHDIFEFYHVESVSYL